jgi:8-oxo-dGTP pyrophosphatase MutT (NUDIX family)
MSREAYRVVAPITQGVRDVYGLLPRHRSEAFSDQVAEVVSAQEELDRQDEDKKESLLSRALSNAALGAGVGAILGATKSIPITRDAWNPTVAATTAALSGATAVAFTLGRAALKGPLRRSATQYIGKSDPSVRYVADLPETQGKAKEWQRAQWMPYMAAEGGAIVGGLGSLAGAWALGKPNSAFTGIAGAGAGAVAGLGLGWLYRKHKQRQFLEHVEHQLAMSKSPKAQEAAVHAEVEQDPAHTQEHLEKAAMSMLKEALVTGSGWPVVASNAPLMKGMGGAPDRYASAKNGARRVYDYGLGAVEAFKSGAKPLLEKHVQNEKAASDEDPNAHGEELDDVALGICRVLEEQHGPQVKDQPAPSTKAETEAGPSSAATTESAPSAKVADDRSSLPYRKRVEVYAMKGGKVYGGVYKDGGFGVFGGGFDDDDVVTAATREFAEETGHTITNVRLIPVEPVKIDWNPPYKSDKQAERAKSCRGAQTFFVAGDLDDSNQKPKAEGDDGKSLLRWPRLYTVPEALEFCEKAETTEEGIKQINAARVKVLKHLQGQEKTADSAQFLPRKEVLMFTPDGKIAVRRGTNRRFELPSDIEGKPVPYEQPVQLLPEGGVPEKGVHGYQVALQSAEGELPEGFEGVDPQEALKDLYAALGQPINRQFQSLDRSRARALLRLVKKRQAQSAVHA